MKKIHLLIAAFFVLSNVAHAQVVNIPGNPFKAQLLAASPQNQKAKDVNGNWVKIDTNSDGNIQVSEALAIYYLDVMGSWVFDPQGDDVTGIEAFTNLQVFKCGGLTSLNISGLTALKVLDISGSPSLPIPNLAAFPLLEEFNCSHNNLTSLDVSMLPNLKKLECGYNQLVSVNLNGLTQIQHLNYGHNPQLGAIDLTPFTQLAFLDCTQIGLTALDLTGLDQLGTLYCSLNQLTTLDLSGNTNIAALYCDSNQLSELNLDGCTNLHSLICNNNFLTTLDLNDSHAILTLNCNNNNLSILLAKQLTPFIYISFFTFAGNPNLQYICVGDAYVALTLNKLNSYGVTGCEVNTYCSFIPSGGFNSITGQAHYDADANGCSPSDDYASFVRFNLDGASGTGAYFYDGGTYNIPLPTGTHTVSPVLEMPEYFMLSPSSVTASFPDQLSPIQQNFCISPNGTHSDIEVMLYSTHACMPGQTITYELLYKNKGTMTQSGSVHLVYDDSVLDFVQSNTALDQQSSGNLVWDFENLRPLESRTIMVKVHLNAPTDTPPLNGGDVLGYTASITSALTDEYPEDNTIEFNEVIVNSYDPNDKICVEGAIVSPELVGKYVHYVVRFENTGTANAQNIVVKDLIDTTKFDIATLVPLSGSHPFETRISSGNKAEFIFENINLPFDDANNDGYVAFKIKTKPTLVVGNTFSNTGSIYFDYNFPIITNTATTAIQLLGTPDFEFSDYFTLYPNPAKDVLKIHARGDVSISSVEVYNMLGQIVLAIPNASSEAPVDVSNLDSGTYFLRIRSDKGMSASKFIKE
jgi:hypothetical protein